MREKLTSVAAVVSAGLASICCIGPLILLALGLGGVGLAARFEAMRPWFLGLTALFLLMAFYFTYRKREIACADGTCKVASGSPKMKAALWIITVLAVTIATFPHWSGVLLSKQDRSGSAEAAMITFKVSGMTCGACAVSIEKSLESVAGVDSASVDFRKGEVTVNVKESVATQELVKAIQKAGPYTVEQKVDTGPPKIY